MKMPEILAPAGDEKCARAAINAGANAIYLGLTSFSARSSAQNFDIAALKKLVNYAHILGVKIYVAMNTLVKDSELPAFLSSVSGVWNAGADAIIIQDIYLGAYIKRVQPKIVLHLSTQAGVCNAYGAQLAKDSGFSRVILSRETSFKDIEKITKIIETECFVQGALCTSFSGQCYLSSFAGGNSGNRGKCKQPCRKLYKIDRSGFDSFAYRISLSDLCLGEDIKKYAEIGVSSFKIEGRMRRAEYVSAAVNYYKNILCGKVTDTDFSALKRTYNRGNYTKGLAFGQNKSLLSSAVQGHMGEFCGVIFVQNGKYVCKSALRFQKGDCFKILRDGKELCGAVFAENVSGGFVLSSSVRLKNGDKAFVTTDVSVNQSLNFPEKRREVNVRVYVQAGFPPRAVIDGREYTADFVAEKAKSSSLTAEDIRTCFSKVGELPFKIAFGEVCVENGAFAPISGLNSFRRAAYNGYANGICVQREKVPPIPIPAPAPTAKHNKTCVISRTFAGVKADIAVLKPADYSGDLTKFFCGFKGEKFLYLPPYLTGEEIERIKPLIAPFDGVYCGGYYSIPLARELNKKLFAGAGFNIFNQIAADNVPADYFCISKELTAAEVAPLSRKNSFALCGGAVKVMDLIYCPFGKTCAACDKRDLYTLTDDMGRSFPLVRYALSACRFEVYNCAYMHPQAIVGGTLYDFSVAESQFKTFNKGHLASPVL